MKGEKEREVAEKGKNRGRERKGEKEKKKKNIAANFLEKQGWPIREFEERKFHLETSCKKCLESPQIEARICSLERVFRRNS